MTDKAVKRNNFSRGVKRLLIFLARVILIVIIVGVVGIAVYFGAPVLIDEYLLKDVNLDPETRRFAVQDRFSRNSK